MEEHNEKLFIDFPPVSITDWEARIREDLKGADYDKKLIWRTLEGIKVKPYYTVDDLKNLHYLEQAPGRYPYVRGNKTTYNNWEIRQDFIVFEVASACKKAQLAVEKGATAIGFDLRQKGDLYYHDFRQLLSGIDYTRVSLNLIAGETAPDILDYLLKATKELNLMASDLKGSLCYDPIGHLTSTGGFYRSEEKDFIEMEKLLLTVENEISGFRVLPINSHFFGNGGATIVQELAFGLSIAAEYMTRFTDQGHVAGDIATHMQWNLGVGSNYFMELAKVRAARLLFSYLLDAYCGDNAKSVSIFIHSLTTDWNKTIYDPYLNMLRLTTEAMAAILGGCNSLLVKPYNSWYKEPDGFSERISRNIQIILKEESYFDKVIDPAAGSYYIETLTDSLIEHAWQLFLKIDEKGGYIKAFIDGFIRDEVNKTAIQRLHMVATKKEILLGTNQYPNFNEKVMEQVVSEIAFHETSISHDRITEPLILNRAAVEFEKLRLTTENHKGGRPRVFMLTYGNLAMRLARSQFSGNFFACAGYEVIDNLDFKSIEEGVHAAMQAKVDIVVVCSSDEEYPAIVPAVYDLVNGEAIVVVAGAPACMEELKQKGIQDFIHVRSNMLETLRLFHQRLGIS